ncbi:MAG: hypothetical protein JWP95_446 [Actinotalea sp.]|nr:hypothetical protein [Actinotalea sp.]
MSQPTNVRTSTLAGPPTVEAPRRRRRRLVWGAVLVVLGVVAVLGGTRLYASYLAPEGAEPLALSEPTASPEAPGEPVAAAVVAPPIDVNGAWTVAQGSVAGYRLDEVLSGVETTVVGRTVDVSGTVAIDGGMLTQAEVVVVTDTVETDESARDAYFRRAVGSDEFPTATFVLTAPVDVAAVGDATAPVAVSAPGTFTFHGVSMPVVAELQVNRTAEGVEVFGTIPVVLADYGLEAPDLGFVTVQPAGEIEMLLRLAR